MAATTFVFLNDPGSQEQRLIRNEHISAITINQADQLVTLYLVGGQELVLTHEESKQFVQYTKGHMHPPAVQAQPPAAT
jgi:hypothetical protein